MKAAGEKAVAFRSYCSEILAGAVEIDRSLPRNVPAVARHTHDCQ
jgi:hypothetical protein